MASQYLFIYPSHPPSLSISLVLEMSGDRRRLRRATAAVSVGCGCRQSKISGIFRPKPKPKSPRNHGKNLQLGDSPSPSPWYVPAVQFSCEDGDEDTTTTATVATTATAATTFSPNPDGSSSSQYHSDPEVDFSRGFGRIGGRGTVAVEKESDDPYLDFRRSMIQMILQKEIYSKDGLKELLNCFLDLNSPSHHGIIIRAFTEIWNVLFCLKARGGAAIPPEAHRSR